MEGKNNKIVMINSFKGGAGKTTVALCRCVSEYKEKFHHNIFYVDMDILGTGVNYILSLENQNVYYNDIDDTDKCKLPQKVQQIMWDEKKGNRFYVAVLNPLSRIKQSYGGQDRLRAHPDVERGMFRKKVKEMINQIVNCGGNNLIVLDCAPGISYMEENILEDLYQLEQNDKKSVYVEEIYVTTPDASHIRKTVDNLNECSSYLRQHNREVTVLINDLYNCEGMDKRCREEKSEDFLFKREDVIQIIQNDLNLYAVKILYKPYNEDILKGSIIKNEIKLINKMDCFYTWPRERDGK